MSFAVQRWQNIKAVSRAWFRSGQHSCDFLSTLDFKTSRGLPRDSAFMQVTVDIRNLLQPGGDFP